MLVIVQSYALNALRLVGRFLSPPLGVIFVCSCYCPTPNSDQVILLKIIKPVENVIRKADDYHAYLHIEHLERDNDDVRHELHLLTKRTAVKVGKRPQPSCAKCERTVTLLVRILRKYGRYAE